MSVPPLELHRDDGDGPPVVLLHGFPDTAETWDGIAEAVVAAGFRVIVPHLRGYTRSSIVPGRSYGARQLAEDVLATLDDLDLETATLVGHDWGAQMAYGAASLAPERVTALVPIAIPHQRTIKPTPAMFVRVRHFIALKLPWAAWQFSLANLSGVDILYRRWAPNWTGAQRDACIARIKIAMQDRDVLDATLDYYRDLRPTPDRALNKKLSQPVLVVGGTHDLLPAEAFAASEAACTGPFEVLIVPGAGHWPHREGEAEFTERLLAFLDEHA